ncbi:hypothetical protein [Streptomyces hebeiensis]
MTNRPRPAHGRGRPTVFNNAARARFLQAVTEGMLLAPAAAHAGVVPEVPRGHARKDPDFAAQLAEAKALGRKVRQERAPHDEARYNNQGCRCRTCKSAAAAGRAARRGQPSTHPKTGRSQGEVVGLPERGEIPPSFSLARAS